MKGRGFGALGVLGISVRVPFRVPSTDLQRFL